MKTKITIVSFALVVALTGTSQARAENAPAVHYTNILSTKLPSRLLTSIKKNYSNYWITDLQKQVVNGKVSYQITLESADEKIILNARPSTGWTRTSTINKDIASR